MKTSLTIIYLLVVLAFLPQIPGCVMANMPKTGRVIDATTGKGMAGVAVIASAQFAAQNLIHGSNVSCRYRIITHTDADGGYYISNTWSRLAFGLPGTDPQISYAIVAYKAGYVIDGDERAWTFDKYGQPGSPGSEIAAWWLGPVVRVETIRMKPAALSLKQEAVYYSDSIAGSFFGCDVNRLNVQEVTFRRSAYDILMPKVCSLPSSNELDDKATGALIDLVPQLEKANERLKQLEPENWGKDSYMQPKYRAEDVCKAMQAGGDLP